MKETKRYSLDIIVFSSTKRRGSDTDELDNGWELLYSSVEPARFARAGVGILVSPQQATCADEWIPGH